MVTINSANRATGATNTIVIGQGVGSTPTFSAAPTFTSITFGSGTALNLNEEGTWTPTIVGATTAGTTTYSSQQGYYTRVGNLVTIWCLVTALTATGTGDVLIGGLPYTINSQSNYSPVGDMNMQTSVLIFPAGCSQITCLGLSGTKTAKILGTGTSSAGAFVQIANGAATFFFILQYQV